MIPAIAHLQGFSGEISWSLGQISLMASLGDGEHSTSASMNFMVVGSLSPYNGCRLSNPTSGIKSSGLRVLWLNRIDQEEVFVVWFSSRSRRVSSVWATRFPTMKSSSATTHSKTDAKSSISSKVEIGMPLLRCAEINQAENDEGLLLNLDILEERREKAAVREVKYFCAHGTSKT
ncbi:hypothetical protein Tco_1460715 [Tanacetum coccineum]